MRVLVVKLSSLGDVIHTLPALTDAAAALPQIRFDWVVEEAFAEVPSWHPAVDSVIPVALRRWRRHPLRDFAGREWRQARSALQRRHYDAVIDAQGLMKSALLARLVQAPRYGMDRHSVREALASLAYHHRLRIPRAMHAVERSRLLFAQALGYPFASEPGALPVDYGLQAKTAARAVTNDLLFFHGSARPEKLWPQEHWVALADLATAGGYRVRLPWGSVEEQQRAAQIAAAVARPTAVQVLPRLDLAGIAGLLRSAAAVVAVDTGLGHLAAALDVPAVSLYGPTDPQLIGAYGRQQLHLRAPATGPRPAALQGIAAPAVWEALQGLLAGAGQSAASALAGH